MKKVMLIVAALGLLALAGCDSDDDSTPAANVAGKWAGSVVIGGKTSATEITVAQSGNHLTGTMAPYDGLTGNIEGDSVHLTGSVQVGIGATGSMVFTIDETADMTMTVAGETMSGQFHVKVVRSTGAIQDEAQGTISLTRI